MKNFVFVLAVAAIVLGSSIVAKADCVNGTCSQKATGVVRAVVADAVSVVTAPVRAVKCHRAARLAARSACSACAPAACAPAACAPVKACAPVVVVQACAPVAPAPAACAPVKACAPVACTTCAKVRVVLFRHHHRRGCGC